MSCCSCNTTNKPQKTTKIESYIKVVSSGGSSNAGSNKTDLPIASEDTLGGIKVGEGLLIDENGVLSIDPEETCTCDDDRILDGGDADGEIDIIQYLDGGSAAGV